MKKIKQIVTIFAALALAVTAGLSFAGTKTKAAGSDEFTRTAIEIAADMGYGWNLGNTMEATNTWTSNPKVTDFETAWGQPVTTKAMIDGIKKAGFNSIRIPVSWSNMMSSDGNYTIDASYFKRVDEIISYAFANDMYVIINDHYDGGWWEHFCGNKRDCMKHYKNMWTQVAEHYKDYSEKLIFESANEELGDSLKKSLSKIDVNISDTALYNLVNEINQTFVDIVRQSGGNNARRYLLIAGFNTDIDKTCSSLYEMPTDTISNHLMVSVHYYTPWTYVGLHKDEGYGYMASWGTDSDKSEMAGNFAKMKKFTDAGYGVVVGEYSVLSYNNDTKAYERKTGDTTFIKYLLTLCDKYGYAPYVWDAGDWYNRYTCSMRWRDIAAIYDPDYIIPPKTPALKTPENVTSGINVSWNKVDGAQKYYVYRKTSGTSWSRIAEVTSTSYVDKTAKSGSTYTYTVRPVNKGIAGGYDKNGKSIKRLADTKVTSVTNVTSGITVKWSRVAGAAGYYVYRKTSTGSWSRIAELKGASTLGYTDTKASAGVTYIYTVRPYSGNVKGDWSSTGTLKRLADPTVASVTNVTAGITVKWNKTAGASGYIVYRKGTSGSWTRIADVKSGSTTSYTDKTASGGSTYSYTVRAYAGKTMSDWHNYKSLKRLADPKFDSAYAVKAGITLKWRKVTGAGGYILYRKTPGGSWARIADIKSGSTLKYVDTTAARGVKYSYTIRAYSGKIMSSWSSVRNISR